MWFELVGKHILNVWFNLKQFCAVEERLESKNKLVLPCAPLVALDKKNVRALLRE